MDQLRKKHTLTAPESIVVQDSPVLEEGIEQPVSSVTAEPAGWEEPSPVSQEEPEAIVEQLPKAGRVAAPSPESLAIRKSAREKREPDYLKDFVR